MTKPIPGISPHFSYEELTQSDIADELGLKNVPSQTAINNLIFLAVNLLEPLRSLVGRPIQITSGYRSKEINRAVGGSEKSQHCKGQAVDIYIHRMKPLEIAKTIVKAGFKFDQLIVEPGWLHVSYSRGKNRQECLISKILSDGKIGYDKLLL